MKIMDVVMITKSYKLTHNSTDVIDNHIHTNTHHTKIYTSTHTHHTLHTECLCLFDMYVCGQVTDIKTPII